MGLALSILGRLTCDFKLNHRSIIDKLNPWLSKPFGTDIAEPCSFADHMIAGEDIFVIGPGVIGGAAYAWPRGGGGLADLWQI